MTTDAPMRMTAHDDADRMRRLVELSRLVSGSLDVQEVCDFVARVTADLLGCDLARLWLLEAGGTEMHLAAQATAPGLAPPLSAPSRLPVETLIGHVAVTQTRRYSPELAEDPLQRNPRWVRENGYRSQMALPLVAAGRSLGSLTVVYRLRYEPDPGEIEVLEAFAAQAAVALRNASLYSALSRSNEELERARQQLEHQTLHDPLTELPNRVLFADRLEQAVATAQRDGRGCAVLLLDLDGFKDVNDRLGHHAGDLLLQQIAQRLRGALRASDSVARLGGDEFGAVLPAADTTGARAMASRLVETVRHPFFVEGNELRVGLSIGTAVFPKDGPDPEALQRAADASMYEAKRARKRTLPGGP